MCDVPPRTKDDFLTVAVGSSSAAISFTIDNLGTQDLVLNGNPIVTIAGLDPEHFAVPDQPTSPVLPAGTTTFTIVFSPTENGTKKATVNITSNDANENPYTFEVKGRGT